MTRIRFRKNEPAPNVRPDGPVIKVLFVLSCLLIGGVVFYFAAVATIHAGFAYFARNGVVKAEAYAATDEQSLLKLENANLTGEDLSALTARSDHHIVLLAPSTPVFERGHSFYDVGQQKLTRKPNNPSARPVLRVKVLAGPEKGKTVWIAERDVGFYAAL